DEKLLRVPFANEEGEIVAKHRLVQVVAFEAATDEIGTGAAKQPPQRPERQIDAGGDVRRTEVVGMKQVRQNQVVEMAAMTRHQYDRVLLDAFDALVEPFILEALEYSRPDAVEQELQHGKIGALVVGGDLVEVAFGRAPQLRLGLVALHGKPCDQRSQLVAL